jgi:lipoprotein-anchoring transpeptidase ErfK/SrfK
MAAEPGHRPGIQGQAISSGCIFVINEDIIDLFDGVEPGAIVVVLAAGPE